ncbi:hypothetical protein NDU88_000481 [Pleurodeles waltl]|uniref:Uncharacterized protein n=1 Tax=Pleurodeles waltl TaxID=8319 RepID=A0AAV7P4B0_PLEWA|nr:hypothetical protein NDU88_000481 [Pleurodeles waltl]
MPSGHDALLVASPRGGKDVPSGEGTLRVKARSLQALLRAEGSLKPIQCKVPGSGRDKKLLAAARGVEGAPSGELNPLPSCEREATYRRYLEFDRDPGEQPTCAYTYLESAWPAEGLCAPGMPTRSEGVSLGWR